MGDRAVSFLVGVGLTVILVEAEVNIGSNIDLQFRYLLDLVRVLK